VRPDRSRISRATSWHFGDNWQFHGRLHQIPARVGPALWAHARLTDTPAAQYAAWGKAPEQVPRRGAVVSEQRASRVSDIRSFVAEVMRELAVRPLLDDPLDAVTWLGDITAVVAGDDASQKRRLEPRRGKPSTPTAVASRAYVLFCLPVPLLAGRSSVAIAVSLALSVAASRLCAASRSCSSRARSRCSASRATCARPWSSSAAWRASR
jgi:hypothetical protein